MKNGDAIRTIRQQGNKVFINDEEIEMPKSIFFSNTITTHNTNIYLNGKEFKNEKWKYTFKSLINTIF